MVYTNYMKITYNQIWTEITSDNKNGNKKGIGFCEKKKKRYKIYYRPKRRGYHIDTQRYYNCNSFKQRIPRNDILIQWLINTTSNTSHHIL